eukprot:CAMPEP_0196740606 /NCGR_PEP_ID=MMETSP1091-20130531/33751_1 /TAXON_ID=302021 /ORGANISM="Rhodomonas sp., Strain CCMP768" /LENGTH=114 /DNA_ID=CAMNT_0042085843 /DNA_START=46 /DNA_END=390 /DNA_ORIENTATION=+
MKLCVLEADASADEDKTRALRRKHLHLMAVTLSEDLQIEGENEESSVLVPNIFESSEDWWGAKRAMQDGETPAKTRLKTPFERATVDMFTSDMDRWYRYPTEAVAAAGEAASSS